MPRIAPDSNDVIVHYLNDTGPTHSNSGSAGSSGDFTDYGDPVPGVSGLFNASAYYMPGQLISSNHDGSGGANNVVVTPNISISAWIFIRKYASGYGAIFNKQYYPGGWSSPYIGIGLYINNTTDGRWIAYISTSGVLRNLTMAGNYILPVGTWCHIGQTWDGTTLTAYLNGTAVGTLVPGGGDIDYGSNGKWFIGAVPDTGTLDAYPIIIQDVRVADIVRPQSYFANIYFNGNLP